MCVFFVFEGISFNVVFSLTVGPNEPRIGFVDSSFAPFPDVRVPAMHFPSQLPFTTCPPLLDPPGQSREAGGRAGLASHKNRIAARCSPLYQ